MEIKLTDIRGEPPLKVGEFILDKDNNVMYVGSGDFELTRNGGAEIYAILKAEKIPPKQISTIIKDIKYGNIQINFKKTSLRTIKLSTDITDTSTVNIEININSYPLKNVTLQTNIEINNNFIMEAGVKNVT